MKHRSRSNSRDGHSHTHDTREGSSQKRIHGAFINGTPFPASYPPSPNGVIALWPNTRVVKTKYYVSQKQNGFNNKIHWYSILLTFLSILVEILE